MSGVTLIAFGLCWSQCLIAQEMQVGYSDAVTMTSLTNGLYQRHPARLNETAQQEQVDANAKLADSFFADVASIKLRHQNDFIGSNDGLQEWEGNVEMPLWLSGQKQQQLVLSETMSAELPIYQQQVRLQASSMARELVWHVVQADVGKKQAYQTWQSALKLTQDVMSRVAAGDLAKTEQLLSRSHSLEMQNEYLLAEAELEYALKNYQYLTGETALPVHHIEPLSTQVELTEQHPQLQLYDYRISTLRAQQGLARFDGATNSSLSIGMRSEREVSSDDYVNSVGVDFSFALDDTTYRQPMVTAATRALADTEVERQQLNRDLKIHLVAQQHALETMRKQLHVLTEKNSVTQQYLALQQHAFDLGEIDLVGLLRSQIIASKTQSRKQMLEVNINYMIANVNQALGVIL